MEPEFQPYGLPHLSVILLTIVLPFALAAIVWRTKSPRAEKVIIGVLSAVLVLNYIVYLIFIRSRGTTTWQQMLPMQLCDWGMVVVIRSNVHRKSALVRGCIFLGNWRHVAGCAHAKPPFWLSRLAIRQLFHLALRDHHRRRLPDVDAPIPAISHVDRARVSLVGVLFCGHVHY